MKNFILHPRDVFLGTISHQTNEGHKISVSAQVVVVWLIHYTVHAQRLNPRVLFMLSRGRCTERVLMDLTVHIVQASLAY